MDAEFDACMEKNLGLCCFFFFFFISMHRRISFDSVLVFKKNGLGLWASFSLDAYSHSPR